MSRFDGGQRFSGASRFEASRFSAGLGGGVANFITDALNYGATNLSLRLDEVSGGGVADVLELTTFNVNDVDNIAGGITEAAVSPNLAATPAPGAKTGSNKIVSALDGSVDGVLCVIGYEVTANDGTGQVFPGTGNPFTDLTGTDYPATVGVHYILATGRTADTIAAARTNGNITISGFGVFRAEWNALQAGFTAGDKIDYQITRGDVTTPLRTVYIRAPGELYADGTGSDTTGTGAEDSPYREISKAASYSAPGDTVFVGPGVYQPFEVPTAGTSGSPVKYTTKAGNEWLPIIRGELQSHIAQGGAVESTLPEASRDGIRIDSKDWVIIENLTIEWVWRHGIFVVGTVSEQHGHHIIRDNRVRNVGRGGIYVGGSNSDTVIPSAETTSLRTIDVLIENNDITQTNLEIDQQGFGNVEAIAAAASASSIVTRLNNVYDTLQYGIDYKAGINGSYTPVSGDVNFDYGPGNFIEENTVTNTERHGIYVDAGQRFAEDITIRNNVVTGCRHGIVLARENGVGSNAFLSLDSIDIYNNLLLNSDQIGLYFHRHPGDFDSGNISNIRARFNTIVNADRDGGFKDLNLDGWSTTYTTATMTGNDVSGNLVYSDQQLDQAVNLTGGWSLVDNFNVVDGLSTGADPLFTDAAGGDYSLGAGSPAIGIVAGIYVTGDFATDIEGVTRTIPASAGAQHRDAILHSLVVTDNSGATPDAISLTAEAAGTVYAGIYPTGTLKGNVNAAALIAGTDTGQIGSAYSLGTIVGAGGDLTDVDITPTGLVGGTNYFAALVQDINDAGSYSNIVGGEFEENAAAAVTVTYLDVDGSGNSASAAAATQTATLDMTSHDAANRVIVALGAFSNDSVTSHSFNSVTLNGVSATQIINNAGTNVYTAFAVFPVDSYPASSNLVADFSSSSTTFNIGAAAYDIPPTGAVALLKAQTTSNRSASDVGEVVTAGQGVVAVEFSASSDPGSEPTWAGDVTQDVSIDVRSSEFMVAASASNVAAGTLAATTSALGNALTSTLSVKISP